MARSGVVLGMFFLPLAVVWTEWRLYVAWHLERRVCRYMRQYTVKPLLAMPTSRRSRFLALAASVGGATRCGP